MPPVRTLTAVAALALIAAPPRADAGTPSGAPGMRPSIEIARTDTPPEIDGRLDDEVWITAPIISAFTQVDPFEGAEPTQRTEVRLLYDDEHLYVAVRCYDDNPGGIRVTQLQRDGAFDFDDYIEFTIDPFLDRRNGFLFSVNPAGARRDALIEDNRNERLDWDGIWAARSTIDDLGWAAEVAIPFKTLSLNENTTTWGFNIQRVIRRNRETVRWAAPLRSRPMRSLSDAGDLAGIDGINHGIGIDLKPHISLTWKRDNETGKDDFEIRPGTDLFIRFTPSLTLALTTFTDFAEVEVDDRQINLTRFPLFFPEKRDFFLQDAGVFNFGGISRNPLPYFSRRIGIGPDGQPVDILFGARLTGRVGDLNLGIMNVQLDSGSGLPEKNVTVSRVAFNILEESTAGFIVTSGDPQTTGNSTLVGGDFNYRNSRAFGSDVLEAHAWYQQSWSSGDDGAQNAFGGFVRYNSDVYEWRLFFTHIDEDFNPALGFSPRRGIREYISSNRYRWRPTSTFRRIDLIVNAAVFTDMDDVTETVDARLPELIFETESGEELSVRYENRFERLDDPFEIQPGIVIPSGRYRFDRFGARVTTSSTRPVQGSFEVIGGEFYDGDRLDLIASLQWRPSPYASVILEYTQNDVDLPGGSFTTEIARARLNFALSPDLSWNTTVQWDNNSDTMGINSRIRWEFEPGQEVFLVLNQGFDTDDNNFDSLTTEITFKLGLTIRF